MNKIRSVTLGILFLCGVASYNIAVTLLFQGCTTSQQTLAYQSISVTETAVLAANRAFLDSVVTGQTPTNSVPKVEADFNALQLALHTAASLASGGNAAPTPPSLFVQATSFTNTINSAKGK